MEYGNLHMRINEILQGKGISKNRICKDLDIPQTNFNKYCRDDYLINIRIHQMKRQATGCDIY